MRQNSFFLKSLILILGFLISCNVPKLVLRSSNQGVPSTFESQSDSNATATLPYKRFFNDSLLVNLIDTAMVRNQELNLMQQEVSIALNEIRARKGEYLPFVNLGASAGMEKVGLYTSQGANDANTNIKPNQKVPEYLPNLFGGAMASWEVDIWRRLRNARDASAKRYLASIEGRNFTATRLIAEIASGYYELMALDNRLKILRDNLTIQQNALQIVKLEKSSARVTELAVKKFEAEVYKNQSHQYELLQSIKTVENRINFLLGRAPQPIGRSKDDLTNLKPLTIASGLPSGLLVNRPDIRQLEENLKAAQLDVKVARANFLPSFRLDAALGLQSFSPAFFLKAPESMLLSLGGGLIGPLVNRNAIKAAYNNADAKQIQAVIAYEQSVLNALAEVSTQMAAIQNLEENISLKNQQVNALNQSIDISLGLFISARADYMEVLLTQRDALDARFDLVETKLQQMIATVGLYQALGGGWR